MALPNPMEAFVWGAGGARKTPEQIARDREIAAAMINEAGDTSPVGHWTQGAARMVNALGGVLKERRADKAAQTNASADGDFIAKMLSGGDSNFPPAPSSSGAFPAAPVADIGDYASQRVAQAHAGGDTIRSGLVARGLPEHVADAFVMNFQDESGLNPGINEQAPIVPGSRGGFGLAQWTGPRRRALESFASERGLPVADPELQMDFLMSELQGPEANAMKSIMAAPDSGSAAAAIVNNFLRPAESHRASREARYLRSGQGGSPVQVASLDPSSGMQTLPSPVFTDQQAQEIAANSTIPDFQPNSVDPATAMMPVAGSSPTSEPAAQAQRVLSTMMTPEPLGGPAQGQANPQQQIAQALMGPNTPLDQVPVMAGGTSGAIQPGQTAQGINPAIIEALSSPYASDQTKKIAGMLLGQQMEQQAAASDPMRAMELERAQLELDALRNPQPQQTAEMQNLIWRAQQAGLQPGTREYADFMVSGGKGPMVSVNTGSNTSKFVEESDKAAATRLNEIVTAGQAAPQTMADMQQLIDLGAAIGTGQGAQLKAKLGPYAHALGIDISDLEDIQAYEAITSRLAPQMRATGSGASSDRDVSMFLQSLPSLRNLPQGNEIIANTMKSVAQNKMNAAEIASRAQRGEISWQDADKQIRELPNPYDVFKEFQKQGAKKTVIDGYTIEQVD